MNSILVANHKRLREFIIHEFIIYLFVYSEKYSQKRVPLIFSDWMISFLTEITERVV